ncbi:hypothetical protein EDD17DRAFT_1590957, partial [Pisolithus thermaeus]
SRPRFGLWTGGFVASVAVGFSLFDTRNLRVLSIPFSTRTFLPPPTPTRFASSNHRINPTRCNYSMPNGHYC